MFVDSDGNLALVDVTGEDEGVYHCQVNQSGVVVNGSSYVLMVLEPSGYRKSE